MKRLALILILITSSLIASGQELERFSPSWTFEVPGATKAELEERAYRFRILAKTELDMPDFPMRDSKHRATWVLTFRHPKELGRLNSLISNYITVIPEEGEYTVRIEKLNVTAYNGVFRISEDIDVKEDDGEYYNDKRVLKVIQDAKAFAIQQVEELLPLIREKMETREINFNLEQVD